jgi:hypothetical protein
MNDSIVLNAIGAMLILMVPVNAYIVWHGWALNRSVTPRSPVLRALLWVKFSVWLLNLYFALIGYRHLNHLDPLVPFGGWLLGVVILFVLLVPLVVHSQMKRFIGDERDRADIRNLARDTGRDEIRDPARDVARDAEHDAGP